MKDKIARAKEFAQNHRDSILFSAGALTGATAVLYATVKYYGGDIYAIVPAEKLQKLIDDPATPISYPFERSRLFVVNADHPQIKK